MGNYAVIDRKTKEVIKRYPENASLELMNKYMKLAKRLADKKDLEYGAVRYLKIIENV